MQDQTEPMTAWQRLVGFCIDNKLIVAVPLALALALGLAASPLPWGAGLLPDDPVAVDALPDTGENQQIVFTDWPGRSPRDIEDQITYPLSTALLSVPKVRTVRSQSMFGFSTIYVIFEDDAGFYWSRERILERLQSLPGGTLPDGVTARLGPDATALGQIFWYTLEGHGPDGAVAGGWDLDELRSIQDWQVRYALQAVDGVSEVSSIGGFVREYQVDVDPEALRAHDVSIDQVAAAVRASNQEVGARTLEINRVEYLVRSRGFIDSTEDLERAVITVRDGVPIRVADVGRVSLGPASRRGALDDAGAEAVGGVVVARYGANPQAVIEGVKRAIAEIAPTLPQRVLADGSTSQVTVVPFYDRTQLIDETIHTLSEALTLEILITILVVLVMLRHLRSSMLISSTVPMAVLLAFGLMKLTGVDANIMSLAGIAIAIGTMVDMGIVLTENVVRRLEEAAADEPRRVVIRRAAAEVAPAILTATATTVVSFLPVFALTAAEGKLFQPLAFTKTYALVAAVLLAIAVLPALAHLLFVPPAPPADGADRSLRSMGRALLRPQHLADWFTLAAGAATALWLSTAVGVLLILIGWLGLVRPLLPPAWRRVPPIIEIVSVIAVVGVLLAGMWTPLGVDRGLAINLLFVAALVGLLLGGMALLYHYYPRILRWTLANKGLFLLAPAAVVLFGLTAWRGWDRMLGWLPGPIAESRPVRALADELPGLGSEYMPPFDEGSFLVMPTTMPHASLGQALDLLQDMDAAIAAVPEVDRVVGKLGRADSALDPAPVSMFETVVTYHPEFSRDADGTLRRNWRDHIRTPDDIWSEIAAAARLPGLTAAPKLMPIETRRVMLQTGMRGTLGVRVRGPDLASVGAGALTLEEALRGVPSVRPETVAAERVVGKPYLEIELDRETLGRYGLTVDAVQDVIEVALGGRPLTRTVEGRERYPVRVRYMREERDNLEALEQVLVPTPAGQHLPLIQLGRFEYVRGPQMIKAEDTFVTAYVIFGKVEGAAEVEVVNAAREHLAHLRDQGQLALPAGVTYEFAGSYENQVRSAERLAVLVPVALMLVFFILYLQFRRVATTLIIYSGVVVAVCGGFVLLWLYGRPGFLDFAILGVDMRELFQVGTVNLSVAVWVGIIALIGIATDDGVVMATYLDQQFAGQAPGSVEDIRARVMAAGCRRVRACLMTTATTLLALLPVLTSQGRGSDVMVPMAVPIVGGMIFELMSMFVVPVLYCALEELRLRRRVKKLPPGASPG
jgi:copper/silver efflux system protein